VEFYADVYMQLFEQSIMAAKRQAIKATSIKQAIDC
jgi:hypothetical protein